jgi:hypothetical protein
LLFGVKKILRIWQVEKKVKIKEIKLKKNLTLVNFRRIVPCTYAIYKAIRITRPPQRLVILDYQNLEIFKFGLSDLFSWEINYVPILAKFVDYYY